MTCFNLSILLTGTWYLYIHYSTYSYWQTQQTFDQYLFPAQLQNATKIIWSTTQSEESRIQ